MVIDYTKQNIDEIFAVLNLIDVQESDIAFKCTVCGNVHKADRMSDWYHCDSLYRQTDDPNIRATACELVYRENFGSASVVLPIIDVTVPRMFLHKLVLRGPDKTVKLLQQYADICFSFPDPVRIISFPMILPIPIMTRAQELRETILEKMHSSPAYKKYLQDLRSAVERCINFVAEHADLFVPHTSEPVVCRRGLSDLRNMELYLPDRDTTFKMAQLVQDFMNDIDRFFILVNNALYHDGAVINGAFLYMRAVCKGLYLTYNASPLFPDPQLFEFSFQLVNETKYEEDPIMAYMNTVCTELYGLVEERVLPVILREVGRFYRDFT